MMGIKTGAAMETKGICRICGKAIGTCSHSTDFDPTRSFPVPASDKTFTYTKDNAKIEEIKALYCGNCVNLNICRYSDEYTTCVETIIALTKDLPILKVDTNCLFFRTKYTGMRGDMKPVSPEDEEWTHH